jgi:uroporphyrinogen decarboxylase
VDTVEECAPRGTWNAAKRAQAALSRSTLPDRVPVHAYLGLALLQDLLPQARRRRELLQLFIEDPIDTLVRTQENLGLDPIITSYSQHLGEMEVWPALLLPPQVDDENWKERIVSQQGSDGARLVRHSIVTPAGNLEYAYRVDESGPTAFVRLLDGEHPEANLEKLRHKPALPGSLEPLSTMVRRLAGRAWWTHYVPGPWGMAVEARGIEALMLDTWDRSSFVHDLMRWCTDWICAHVRALAPLKPSCICLNETWVGAGLSPRVYRSFVQQYDAECASAARAVGALVSYHNCGRGASFLEDMVDTSIDALETLTPAGSHGDFDLADAKHRVGSRCCLVGGFDDRVFEQVPY